MGEQNDIEKVEEANKKLRITLSFPNPSMK